MEEGVPSEWRSSELFRSRVERGLVVNGNDYMSVDHVQRRFLVNQRVVVATFTELQTTLQNMCFRLEENILTRGVGLRCRRMLELSPRTVVEDDEFMSALDDEQKKEVEGMVNQYESEMVVPRPCQSACASRPSSSCPSRCLQTKATSSTN